MEASWTCPSCRSDATDCYCGHCGERRLAAGAPIAAKDRVAESARSFMGRARSSLNALVSPPGRLTADWIRGRRVAVLAWYLYVALDTFFGLSRPRRLISVIALVAALHVIRTAYHVVVFAAMLYST